MSPRTYASERIREIKFVPGDEILIMAQIQALHPQPGDLIVVKLVEPSERTQHRVNALIEKSGLKNITIAVIDDRVSIENIPHARAKKMLQSILDNKEIT